MWAQWKGKEAKRRKRKKLIYDVKWEEYESSREKAWNRSSWMRKWDLSPGRAEHLTTMYETCLGGVKLRDSSFSSPCDFQQYVGFLTRYIYKSKRISWLKFICAMTLGIRHNKPTYMCKLMCTKVSAWESNLLVNRYMHGVPVFTL